MFPTPSKEAHDMAAITTIPQPRRFIKRQAVENITGLSCSEIYRRVAAGSFPAQVSLGPKSVVWIEAEVLAWCEARIAESRGEAA
jgi:prophage regulatory protein